MREQHQQPKRKSRPKRPTPPRHKESSPEGIEPHEDRRVDPVNDEDIDSGTGHDDADEGRIPDGNRPEQ